MTIHLPTTLPLIKVYHMETFYHIYFRYIFLIIYLSFQREPASTQNVPLSTSTRVYDYITNMCLHKQNIVWL